MKQKKEYLEIDLSRVLLTLLRRLWLIILAALVVGGGVLAYSVYGIEPLYTADITLYVNNKSQSGEDAKLSISQGDLTAAQSLIDTYGVILTSRSTLDDILARSGLSYSKEELAEMITSEAVNATELLHVEVTGPNPGDAAVLANIVAEVLPERIASIVDGSSVRVVDHAEVPTLKSSPSYAKNALIGGIIGAFAACVIVVIRELKDDQIRSTDDVTENYEEPVLAVIPDLKHGADCDHYGRGSYGGYAAASRRAGGKRKQRADAAPGTDDAEVLGENLNFAASEAYKLLRTNLEFCVSRHENCQIIGITSATRGEGKTTTSINTAYTFAQTGRKVLLIEADMRLPNIARRLKLKKRPGLSNMLSSGQNIQGFLQKSSLIDNLWVITGGDCPPNPAELLGSPRMKHLMQELSRHFDVILMDLPPVGIVTDALNASRNLDGVAVISREKMSTRKGLSDVIRKLKFVDAKVLGFVITGSDVAKKTYKYKGNSVYGEKHHTEKEAQR